MAGTRPDDWTDRTVRGPAADYLSADDFRRLFNNLPEDLFDRLVKDGTIPQPIKLSNRTVMFTWRQAVYLSFWLEFNPDGALPPGKGEKS